ncbi:MAG: MmcQ/YjbR family DNA-binding protein [Actinomycetota bacterium]|nr:MmcQ/YjbR family DNA-binding protein [Actinomycetota bacterium]
MSDQLRALGASTLERVAAICGGLPECEIAGGEHHKLTVRTKTMGWHTVDHHGDGRVDLTIKAAKGENEALVAADPERFFLPPYVAHHGYVGYHLDTDDVDWDEVAELITDAWRLAAPKSLAKQLDT